MGANLLKSQKTHEYWKPLIEKHGSILGVHLATGHSEGTIRRELQRLGIPYSHSPAHVDSRPLQDPDLERVLLSQPTWNPEDCIIINDPHCPYHNVPLINEAISIAIRYGIKYCYIGGDTTDFKKLYGKEPQASGFDLRDEMKATRELVSVLLNTFTEIRACMGNHDWRLVRLHQDLEDARWIYNTIVDPSGRFKMQSENYCLLNGWLYVYHPYRQRKAKGSLSEELGDHNQKSNLGAHDHRFYLAIHDNGKEVVAGGLHATDPRYHNYKVDRLDTFSEWVPGFWIVKGKSLFPYTIHPRIWNPLRET